MGLALACYGALLGGLNAIGFKWATDFAAALPARLGESARSREVFGSAAGVAISNALFLPGGAALGAAVGEPMRWEAALGGIVAGICLAFPYSLLMRAAILETEDLAIGAVRYLTPVLALGWLAAFSLAGAADIWMLAAGAALVAGANALVELSARGGRGKTGGAADSIE